MLAIFYWEDSRTLPAPLSRVHGEVANIGGLDNCAECHGTETRDMPGACLECHQQIGEDIAEPRGIHGLVVKDARTRCAQCHTEHAGRDFELVGPHSFAIAGFETREEFDHPWEGYALDGAHLELKCEECHPLANTELLLDGEERFRGLSQTCESCHDDSPHQGQMMRDCASCHGQSKAFIELPEFVHDSIFPLEGVHNVETCSECHERGTEHSFETLTSLDSPPDVRGCDVCHEPPHSEQFLAGDSLLERAITVNSTCEVCHGLKDPEWQTANSTFDKALHAASGFALDGPHAEQACDECHSPEEPWEARYPDRARSDCAQCHEDPHGGQFAADSEFANCVDCHGITRFTPAQFDVEQHASTGFPLIESHLGVGCVACHEESEAQTTDRMWNEVDTACNSCHEDGHDGFYERFLASVDRAPAPEDCDRCHNSTEFGAESTTEEFEHETWTPFALNDAHEELACDACHARQPIDDVGRTFGWIETTFGAIPSVAQPCAMCHEDAHEDGILQQAPNPWNDAFGCARCHDEVAFENASKDGFDHALWTTRELRGAHLDLECAECHARTPIADSLGRRFGRVAENFPGNLGECSTCHQDIHAGLFDRDADLIEIEGRTGCVRCHTEERFVGSLLLEFDHDLWTQTDLRSGHKALDCQACHPRVPSPTMDSRFRRPARGRECIDCHQDPHVGQFRESKRAECRDCHTNQSDWSSTTFDHDVDSDYALDEVHKDLDCTECHPAVTFPNGFQAVRYKPLPMECADCHKAPGEDP